MNLEYFPYEPRVNQRESISFIQRKIEEGNVCFDAPTGFGKTPIILASLLPYAEDGCIIWAVRTGNETDRPIEELKEIAKRHRDLFGFSYRGKRDMCLLARDLKIESYEGVSLLCKARVKTCRYAMAFEENFDPDEFADGPKLYSEIMDICRHKGICPYLSQRALLDYADVVSLSYNYIVGEGLGWAIRRSIPFDSSYLVIDEAHNLQRLDLGSDLITLGTLRHALKELGQFGNKELKDRVSAMLLYATQIRSDMQLARQNELEFHSEDIMSTTECDKDSLKDLRRYGSRIRRSQLARGKSPHSSLYHLARFWLDSLACLGVRGISFIATRTHNNLKLERWDMRSAEILRSKWPDFKSCIFCSGTLRPTKAFAETIGLKNWNAIHVPSPFDDNRIVSVITKGLTTKGQRLKRSMCARYLSAINSFLGLDANLAIFSASYRIQNALIHASLEEVVERHGKRFFLERQGMSGDSGRAILDEFKASGHSSERGVLCAPMTGRFAEGADFPGCELEGIFLVGIPFDQLTLRTRLYSQYYEDLYGKNKGKYYAYIVPALRRTSQALGRALRSREDRVVFVLGDERYAETRYLRLLPDFVRNNARVVAPSGLSELGREIGL